MHSGLREIANRFQAPLSDRSCLNGYIYDGKTIATNFQKETWDDNCKKVLSVSDPLPIPDDWMAHEIAHWVVADPTEREFPEYGCALGIVGFGAYPLKFQGVAESLEYKRLESLAEGLLQKEEQEFREHCADFLAVHWCDQLGIPVIEEGRPINKFLSPKYEHYRIEDGWKAIIWLRERGLIP